MRLLLPLMTLAAGCWHVELTELPVDTVDFSPSVGAPEGWVVQGYDLPITCPTGEASVLYAVYPEVGGDLPVPAAVVFHSGAFDYVRGPNAADPLAGPHYQDTSRLDREWAQRRAFATLGMYSEDDPVEHHGGAVPAALAEQGLVVLVPTNCWGDYWHNYQGEASNDYATELFDRNGRALAEWTWRVATEAGFATSQGIELPFTIDPNQVYAVGLGEGGRAVGELLEHGYSPRSLLLDSTVDDLRVYYDEPELYAEVNTGLDRIFYDTELTDGAPSWAPLPDRMIYAYSSQDASIPARSHTHMLNVLDGSPDAWVYDAGVAKHVVTSDDIVLARQLVEYILE